MNQQKFNKWSWRAWEVALLVVLYKIFNTAGSVLAVAPMIAYMAPPNPHFGGGDIGPVDPPYMPPASSWWELFLGVLIIVVFLIGCVTVVRWIVKGVKKLLHKGKKVSSSK